MHMMFGGHADKYDYHVVGLNEEFLTGFLGFTGYVNIRKVQEFGLFDDTSNMSFKGVRISLNMIAEKPHAIESDGGLMATETKRNQACPCGSGKKFKHCHGKLT